MLNEVLPHTHDDLMHNVASHLDAWVLMCIILVMVVPFLWGCLDMYKCYRFIRKPEVDWSAGVLWWHTTTWNFASQTKAFVNKFPWVGKDLTEAFGNEEEDDGVTN